MQVIDCALSILAMRQKKLNYFANTASAVVADKTDATTIAASTTDSATNSSNATVADSHDLINHLHYYS